MKTRSRIVVLFIFLSTLIAFLTGCSPTQGLAGYRDLSDADIYQIGHQAAIGGNYDRAISAFEAMDNLYPFGPYARRGQFEIIYAYYSNDDLPNTLAAAERYIRLYPQASNVDYAYYMKGLANFGQGKNWMDRVFHTDPAQRDLDYLKQAYVSFDELVKHFPNSPYAPDAVIRMRYIRNTLARYELQVAKFYFKRKAYVASANRASYVVRHYQGAPQVVDALRIMIKSYDRLGETSLADDARRVLAHNFPNQNII